MFFWILGEFDVLEKNPPTCYNPDPGEAPLVHAVPGGQGEAGGDEGAGAAPEAGAPNKVQPGKLRIRISLILCNFLGGNVFTWFGYATVEPESFGFDFDFDPNILGFSTPQGWPE